MCVAEIGFRNEISTSSQVLPYNKLVSTDTKPSSKTAVFLRHTRYLLHAFVENDLSHTPLVQNSPDVLINVTCCLRSYPVARGTVWLNADAVRGRSAGDRRRRPLRGDQHLGRRAQDPGAGTRQDPSWNGQGRHSRDHGRWVLSSSCACKSVLAFQLGVHGKKRFFFAFFGTKIYPLFWLKTCSWEGNLHQPDLFF